MPKVDDRPGVYDPETESSRVPRSAPNDGLEDAYKQPSAPSGNDVSKGIADLENHANTGSGNSSATNKDEKALQNKKNDSDIPFNPDADDDKPRGLKRLSGAFKTKKRKIWASVAVASATATIAGTVLTAPVFMMNHISSLIIDKTGDLQSRQSITYRRSKFAKLRDNFSVEGRRSGKIIQEMQNAGYRIEFDGRNSNTIARISANGVDIDPDNFGREISDFMDRRYKIFTVSYRSKDWKSKRMEAFYARNNIIRKPFASPDRLRANRSAEEIANEVNFKAINGEDSLETQRRVTGNPADPDNPNNTATNQQAIDDASNPNDGSYRSARESLENGVPVREGDILVGSITENAKGVGPNNIQVVDQVIADQGVGAGAFGAAKGALVITDVGDKLCRIDKSLELAIKTARFVNSVKLMRAAFAFVSADDGQRRGEASSELVRELLKRVVLSDDLGGFASSSGYQSAVNGKYNSAINNETKTGFSTSGELGGFWGGFKNEITSQVPGCRLLTNPFFQVAQVAGVIALTYFTAGTGTAPLAAGQTAARTGITTVVRQLVTRRALLGIAGGFVVELGFDQAITLAQLYVQQQLEVPFTGQEVGGSYSAILFSGAGVLHKQRRLKGGFVPATRATFAAAQDEYFEVLAQEKREKSFAQRIFDMDNSDSLAYKSFTNVAFQSIRPTDSLSNGARNIASLPSLLASTVTSPITRLTGSAYAQEANFDTIEIDGTEYATDPYGNMQTVIPDWLQEYSDPEVEAANTEALIAAEHISFTNLEPRSDLFNDHVANCVDSADTITPMEEFAEGGSTDVTKDCAGVLPLTQSFKGHLINLDADDIVDAALFPEEISEGGLDSQLQVGTPGTTLDAPGLNGYAIPCEGMPTPVVRLNNGDAPHADWSNRESSGVAVDSSGNPINGSDGTPINIYIREACPGATDVKTIFIASSVHGSESGGQLVSHELLYNEDLPDNIRIIAIPEINKAGISDRDNGGVIRNGYLNTGRVNAEGVNLNRNFDYNWSGIPTGARGGNYKGPSVASAPETQAMVNFVQSIDIDLAFHYHDNISYVAAVGDSTPLSLAQTYGGVSSTTRLRSREGGRVYQSGSFDSWQNESQGTPVLLVEMAQDQSEGIILEHVAAVKAVMSGGGF